MGGQGEIEVSGEDVDPAQIQRMDWFDRDTLTASNWFYENVHQFVFLSVPPPLLIEAP